jgi:hypothetical protein
MDDLLLQMSRGFRRPTNKPKLQAEAAVKNQVLERFAFDLWFSVLPDSREQLFLSSIFVRMNINTPSDDAAAVLESHSMDERAKSNKKVSHDTNEKDQGDRDSSVQEDDGKSKQHAASSVATVDAKKDENDSKEHARGDEDGDDDEEADDDTIGGDDIERPSTGMSKRRRTQRDDDEIPLTFPQKVRTRCHHWVIIYSMSSLSAG